MVTSDSGASSVAPWRNKLQVSIVLVVGLTGMVVGILLLYFQVQFSAELSVYQSAGACAAAADALNGATCRYSGAATVTSEFDPTTRTVGLSFAALPGRTFTARFISPHSLRPAVHEPNSSSASAGSSITAELWSGRVTKFAGLETVDSPENIPPGMTPAAAFFGLVGLFVAVCAAALVPRAWRAR